MKVVNFIDETMEQVSAKLREARVEYEKKLSERGIYIRHKAILTAGIVLYVFENETSVDAWAFYPRTGLENYIGSTNVFSDEAVEEFFNYNIDKTLKMHSWHNPEVQRVIEYRKKTHTAAIL